MAAPEPAPAPEPFDGVEMTFVGEEDDFVPMEEHDLRPRRPSLCSCSGGVGPWARRLATFPLAATRSYLVRLRANFGGPFMLMISSSHFGVKVRTVGGPTVLLLSSQSRRMIIIIIALHSVD